MEENDFKKEGKKNKNMDDLQAYFAHALQRSLVKVCIMMIYSWEITCRLTADCISECLQ